MSSSTARRTSIVGLGALGLALVAGPLAAAAPAGAQVPVPLPTGSPLDVLLEAVDPVTGLPLPSATPPLPPLPPVPPPPALPVPVPVPLPGGTTPAPPPAPPAAPAPETAPQPASKPAAAGAPAAQQPSAAAPPSTLPFSDARTSLRGYSAGSGVAVLDAFSAAIGMGSMGGFGTASGLSFDALAPELAAPYASLPGVEAPEVAAAPQVIQLAAGLGAADGPIPAGLPGMTVAAAALAIASAAAAHLAAASRRRDIFS